jgi:hypothetical protein
MRLSQRDWEIKLHNAICRAEKAEQRADDLEHTINLLLNGSFDLFHTGLTINGAVHEFSLGTVRDVPVKPTLGNLFQSERTENRRIILWKTKFEPKGIFATSYLESDFKKVSNEFPSEEKELPQLVETAILSIPGWQ